MMMVMVMVIMVIFAVVVVVVVALHLKSLTEPFGLESPFRVHWDFAWFHRKVGLTGKEPHVSSSQLFLFYLEDVKM